jgi:hypothetical protein
MTTYGFDIECLVTMLLEIAEGKDRERAFMEAIGDDDDAERRERTRAALNQERQCAVLHTLQEILDEADGEDCEIFDALRMAALHLAENCCTGRNGCADCFPDDESRERFAVHGEMED